MSQSPWERNLQCIPHNYAKGVLILRKEGKNQWPSWFGTSLSYYYRIDHSVEHLHSQQCAIQYSFNCVKMQMLWNIAMYVSHISHTCHMKVKGAFPPPPLWKFPSNRCVYASMCNTAYGGAEGWVLSAWCSPTWQRSHVTTLHQEPRLLPSHPRDVQGLRRPEHTKM